MTCAPNGRYVLSAWGDYPKDHLGPHRWNVSLAFRDPDRRPEWIREGIPGADRVFSGTLGKSGSDYPRTWGAPGGVRRHRRGGVDGNGGRLRGCSRRTGVVEVPAGAEVQDAGADWVLLSLTDDFGVERVGLYELLTREVP